MSIETRIFVSIENSTIKNIIDFSLSENVGKHSKLNVSFRGDAVEDRLDGVTVLERSKDFLGKQFSLRIESIYETLNFQGIVTQVKGTKGRDENGMGDIIKLVGMSSSILLSDIPHNNSYSEQNLSEIVNSIADRYSTNTLKVKVNPENDSLIGYTVQNNQNSFDFLKYLAAKNGEYLLYNQDQLYFGKPAFNKEITLNYGYDLKDFNLGMSVKPINFNFLSNDYFQEANIETSSSKANSGSKDYTAFASNQSNVVYPKVSDQQFSSFESQQLQNRIDTAAGLQKKVIEQKQISLKGESYNTGVTLGKQIAIKNKNGDFFGNYRVIKVKHSYKIKGKYINSFTAVPLGIDIYPLTDTAAFNKSGALVAKVTDTNDPEGMSRIKVQFPWQQKNNKTTPWIRVATPYAGGDRGFHFIPEVGDAILVGFENDNCEKPYMQSALYTGANKHGSWQSDANNFKGITTKGGHIIELNDTKDGESILITDKNKNTIHINTSTNDISISAGENMTLNAKNMQINVEENLDVSIGKNKTESIGEDYFITAKNEDRQVSEKIKVLSSEFIQEAKEISTDTSGEIAINAGGKVTIASADAVEYGD